MRRSDRLFDVIQRLRTASKPVTAAMLAAELEVTPRTVYRDIATLQARRVPIEGAPGIGYVLRRGFDLPPLMFTQEEATALVAAARLAQSWVDPAMARDIQTAIGKVVSVLPPVARASAESLALFAPAPSWAPCRRSELRR